MPMRSRFQIPIPVLSFPTLIFGDQNAIQPDSPLLIDSLAPETRYLTAESYKIWSKRFALGLQRAGLKQGDRILLYSGNTLFFPVVFMGVIMAGGIFTGANPTYVARELAYQLSDSGAKFLIAAEESLDTAMEAVKMAGLSTNDVYVFDSGIETWAGQTRNINGIQHWTKLLATREDAEAFRWLELDTLEEQQNTIMALNYSSGTTGVPKGVMVTHLNYVANTTQWVFIQKLGREYKNIRDRAQWLCFLPMYHAMAQVIFCSLSILQRIPVYIMRKFDFLQMLENVQRFRITNLQLVPPIAVAMTKHPAVKNFDLSSVEFVGSGAAPLGREVCAELEKLWPDGRVNVKQGKPYMLTIWCHFLTAVIGWGMTEVTCMALNWLPDQRSESFSVGELAPNCEAVIMDDEGKKEVDQGERGELWVKGPNVMKGYWKKPDATAETFISGWLRTGDIAYVDQYGKFFIVDRKKVRMNVACCFYIALTGPRSSSKLKACKLRLQS
jgi:4-coumarate--CoA ligase